MRVAESAIAHRVSCVTVSVSRERRLGASPTADPRLNMKMGESAQPDGHEIETIT